MNTKTMEEKNAADEQSEVTQNLDPATDPADPSANGAEGRSPASDAPTISLDEYERVKAERDQLFDRMARLQAEFDNARKREARERTEFRDFATAGAVEQFLPVIDNFQLALKAAEIGSGSAEQLRAGVELIVKQMEDVLRSLNVQPVETVGVQFDPHVHESIDSVERVDLPDQQVLEEVRRGYRMRDRLLRPAMVRVVANHSAVKA